MTSRSTYTNKRRYPRRKVGKSSSLQRRVQKLEKVSYPESKYYDISDSQDVTNAGTFIQLNEVPLGNEDIQRNGDNLYMRSVDLNLYAVKKDAVAGSCLRAWLVYDKDNKVQIAADLISKVGTVGAPHGFKTHDKRFWTKIMRDNLFVLDVANANKAKHQRIKINKHTQFEAGSTSINTGKLYLFMISDQSTTENAPTVTVEARLHFADP